MDRKAWLCSGCYCIAILGFAGIAGWQSVKQICQYLQQPVKITLARKPIGYKEFNNVRVCTKKWLTPNITQDEAYPLTYALGFVVNSDLRFGRSSVSYELLNSTATYLKAKEEYENAIKADPGLTWEKYTFSHGGIMKIITDRIGAEVKAKNVKVSSFYAGSQMGCGMVNRFAAESYSLTKLESTRSEPVTEMPSFRFLTPSSIPMTGGKDGSSKSHVTLYLNPLWKLLSIDEHFLSYKTNTASEDSHKHILGTKVTVYADIVQHIHHGNIATNPCIPVHKNHRYPFGFAMRVCEILCEEEAINEVYGCSSLKLLEIPEFESSLPACNTYDYANQTNSNNVFSKYKKVSVIKDKCKQEKNCRSRSYCTEWKITFSSITYESYRPSKIVEQVIGPNLDFQFVEFHLFPIIKQVIESLQLTPEDLMGSLGGILGLWLGASAVTALQMFTQWISSVNRKVTAEKETPKTMLNV